MRQSYDEVRLIEVEGVMIGLGLGFDFCSEHESGIRGLQDLLGMAMDPAVFGVDRRRARMPMNEAGLPATDKVALVEFPKALKTSGPETRLVVSRRLGWNPDMATARTKAQLPSAPMHKGQQPPLAVAWDEDGFILRAFGAAERQMVRDLHQALVDGDLAVGLSGARVFGRGGLNLVIISRMPESMKEGIRAVDEDHSRLLDAALATGIRQRLDDAGLTHHALVPRWKAVPEPGQDSTGMLPDTSAHPVIFWLNPTNQRMYSHGWYTVEDLLDWIEGRGPVLTGFRLSASA